MRKDIIILMGIMVSQKKSLWWMQPAGYGKDRVPPLRCWHTWLLPCHGMVLIGFAHILALAMMVWRCGANANESTIDHCYEQWCLPRFCQWGQSVYIPHFQLLLRMMETLSTIAEMMKTVLTIVMKPTTRSPLSTMPGTPFILNQG